VSTANAKTTETRLLAYEICGASHYPTATRIVPSRWLHSLAIGVRYTDYETATRTGVMITLGL
jgi:hypothetical protein